MQNSAIQRNAARIGLHGSGPEKQTAQAAENPRKESSLNYKSVALGQLSDQRISAINRLRLDTSSLQKME